MQNHRAGVVDFDLLGEGADLSRDGIDLSHEPDGEIRDVNAEIEHRAAAGFGSRREPILPWRPQVRPAVREPRANEVQLADCAAREGVLDSAFHSTEAA